MVLIKWDVFTLHGTCPCTNKYYTYTRTDVEEGGPAHLWRCGLRGNGGGGCIMMGLGWSESEWEWSRDSGRVSLHTEAQRVTVHGSGELFVLSVPPLVLWDVVWVKASGHGLARMVRWWMFRGNLGHYNWNNINPVAYGSTTSAGALLWNVSFYTCMNVCT